MTSVTGLTAARMAEVEGNIVIGAHITGNDLILEQHDGGTVNAGDVRGPIGPTGSGYVICTSSTRPTGLDSGDTGLAIFETDTRLLWVWVGTRWRVQERIVCTNATRPDLDAADEGTEIYETDTNREYTWNGTIWVSKKQGLTSLMVEILRITDTGAFDTDDTGYIGYDELLTFVSGRRYYAHFGYRIEPSAAMGVMFSIWQGEVGGAGVKLNHAEFDIRSAEPQWVEATLPLIITGSPHTLLLSAQSLTVGETFVTSGASDYPGIYQILESE